MGKKTRGNGQGTVFKLPNGKWRVEITLGWDEIDNGKKKRAVKTKSGFKFKRDAVEWLKQYCGGNADAVERITFNDIYRLWSATHYTNITKDMEYTYTGAYKRCEPLYYKLFADIKPADWQRIVDNCQQSRRTKRSIKDLANGMYKYAMANDYVSKNYAEYIKLPPKEETTKDAFTQEEINKIWSAYHNGDNFAGIILVMIYTGMRPGEFLALTKDNIMIDERCIVGAGIKTKTSKSRIIPIAECIYSIVQSLCDKTDGKIYGQHEKVFRYCFKDALDKAGVRPLTPHSCRHTCATALALAEVPPAVIQAVMGHTDYSTTLQYTHVQSLKHTREAVNKISSAE